MINKEENKDVKEELSNIERDFLLGLKDIKKERDEKIKNIRIKYNKEN